MKNSLSNIALLGIIFVSGCWSNNFVTAKRIQHFLGDDDWVLISNHAGGSPRNCDDYKFCATVKNAKPGTTVVLDKCEDWAEKEGWRLWTSTDKTGFVLMLGTGRGYSGNPKAVCMQAGNGNGDIDSLDDRTRVRLAPCDIDNPFQLLSWKRYDDSCGRDEGGRIKLHERNDLCMTWAGTDDVEPGQTSVIFVPCDEVQHRAKWFVR